MASKVVQVMGNFMPQVFQNPMLHDVIGVCLGRSGGPYLLPQGCKAIVVTMVDTTMQIMSHPVRSLCPPPYVALECIR